MVEDTFVTKSITLLAIGALFLLALFVLKSIILSVVVGLLLAYMLHPVFKRINKKIKNKDVATVILILFVIIVLAVPLWFLAPMAAVQTIDTYRYLQSFDIGETVKTLLPSVFSPETARALTIHFNNLVGKFFSSLLDEITRLIVNIPNLFLQFAVALFTFYFAVRDSEKLKDYASKLSPFSKSTEERFLNEFRRITNAVVFGQILIGIIQGLVLGAGLLILGVPRALLLTIIAILTSMIPILGSWLVWLPVSIYLLATGDIVRGIILAIYGGLIVSSIDNLLRPYFLSKSSKSLPIAVALIGVIGGIYTFGILGIVLGPLILAYTLIIIEFYREGRLNELFRK